MQMKQFLVLWLLSQFTCNRGVNITNDYIPTEYSNRRRVVAATAVAVISAIAASTVAAINVGKEIKSNINSYGAEIEISNYFKNVDLDRIFIYKVIDGETTALRAPDKTILPGHTGADGGVFTDKNWTPDGSAGIVRYKAINKLTSKEYCFDYMWSVGSKAMSRSISLCDMPPCAYVLSGGLAIVVSSDRCDDDLVTSFKDIKDFWISKVKNENGGQWNYRYSGYMSGDAMIAFESMDNIQNLRIPSNDYIVAMSASMTKSYETSIAITIGPYKKIYGGAKVAGDWFPFMQGYDCLGSSETHLGQFESVNDCHKECKEQKGSACKYLVFGKNSKYKNCWWEGACSAAAGFEADDYVVISVTDSDYELVENGRECNSGSEEYLGFFSNVDDCKAECIKQKGDNCVYFVFGTGSNTGYCYWEESCSSDNSFVSNKYNVYVVTGTTDIFSSKKKSKFVTDMFVNKYGKHAVDVNDVNDYSLTFIVGLISVFLLAINISCIIYKCCKSSKHIPYVSIKQLDV